MHLELLYVPFGADNSFKNPFDPDFSLTTFEKTLKSGAGGEAEAEDVTGRKKNVIVRGVLSVTVISAEDLPAVDLMGKADPFVVLTLKKSEKKLKTRVSLRTFLKFHFCLLVCVVNFDLVKNK